MESNENHLEWLGTSTTLASAEALDSGNGASGFAGVGGGVCLGGGGAVSAEEVGGSAAGAGAGVEVGGAGGAEAVPGDLVAMNFNLAVGP